MAAPNVKYIRPELAKLRFQYQVIADCILGGPAIKARGVEYLPQPNPLDRSVENASRYLDYVNRAVFYNVTRRTVDGLIGTVFSRAPIIDLPTDLEVLKEDADGAGVNLIQIAKKALGYAVSFGRSGLFIDYPTVEGPVSRRDMQTGEIRPTINAYDPFSIINWREVVVGGKKKLSLVVLQETTIVDDDGYEFKIEPQYRVLRLNEAGIYEVELFVGDDLKSQGLTFPLDGNGNYLDEIPFKFIGAENNDPNPDIPPIYDLASLNIGHYRNSADYEEAVFIVGQPTPFFSGLTEDWVNKVMKGTVFLGSRAVIPLPAGGDAGLLQAAPNPMPLEAMKHKENQMVALGARLIQAGSSTNTVVEAEGNQATSQSMLANATANVSDALLWALKIAARFVAGDEEAVDFKLSNDFELNTMTAEEQKQLISNWQSNAITTSEMRDRLSKAGIATLSIKDYEAERKVDVDFTLENAIELQPDPNLPAPPAKKPVSNA